MSFCVIENILKYNEDVRDFMKKIKFKSQLEQVAKLLRNCFTEVKYSSLPPGFRSFSPQLTASKVHRETSSENDVSYIMQTVQISAFDYNNSDSISPSRHCCSAS